jgi:hypothetical protein
MAYYLLLSGLMATHYRLVRPIAALDPKTKRALTIPSGSFIEKIDLVNSVGLIDVRWGAQSVWVQFLDLIERGESLG